MKRTSQPGAYGEHLSVEQASGQHYRPGEHLSLGAFSGEHWEHVIIILHARASEGDIFISSKQT